MPWFSFPSRLAIVPAGAQSRHVGGAPSEGQGSARPFDISTPVDRLTHWRRALPLIAFGAQVTFVLLLIAFTPHFSSGCPQSTTGQTQADRYDQFVTLIDIGLLAAVAVTLVIWSAGRQHRYAWLGIALIPAVLLAGLSLLVAGLGTMSLCNMIQT